MESPEGIPSLNLEDITSDKQERAADVSAGSPRERRREPETQTGGDAARSEMDGSKSSYELLETVRDDESLSELSSGTSRASDRGPEPKESPRPAALRSSSAREIISPDTDQHLPLSEHDGRNFKSKKKEQNSQSCLESAVQETILAENRRLKEVLSRERRHHTKEKNRIRQVLFAIDEALSSLPSRLGRIRVQNQKNLMKMNAPPIEFRDRGDFEIVVGSCPRYLESCPGQDEDDRSRELSLAKRPSLQFSEDVYSDASNSPNTTLMKKIESLNNLIEEMKKGQPAPIEAVLNNELCAISLLKNEIRYTKKKIEGRSRTESGSVVAHWKVGKQDVPAGQSLASDDVERLERYIWLQKEAISVLSMEVKKTKEMFMKELKEKEQAQSEKKALMSEISRLRNPKLLGESQRSRGHFSDITSVARPFRIIREMKSQLEEKEKQLANCKAKISRVEAAAANKGILLDTEKKKNEELEARLKILSTENKSLSKQMSSLQYINKELKEQMDVLKSQIDILINQKSGATSNQPFDLKKYFAELAESLKQEDAKIRTVKEESEKRLREVESQHAKEVELIKASFERSEKMNFEYMRTLKALLISLHNYELERYIKGKTRNSYERVKEILGITEVELENLFGGNLKETRQKELEDLYDRCYSLVNDEEDSEFSLKLSAWLFDLIKQKMTDQNSNDAARD